MSDSEARSTDDLPDDEHLRNDVVPASEAEPESSNPEHFTPGQTNAGQQVGGLASATGYGTGQDPDEPNTNNPV
ncbi:hypothetical protein FDW83_14930 [Pseudarthrobacter sp. NamE2]|uniref:hypothetical protein n=1 Tax=Pseudarthrobacter sp. NamE2 TaxID=2576838 RepID=UPI0010FDEE87|nr:hypothetical protein [Pseudarthrobacter sp. NamE2]TLM81715.1 hypothetical protein FDW83_14930 [Pseudarthrobacter sp. NamE2]